MVIHSSSRTYPTLRFMATLEPLSTDPPVRNRVTPSATSMRTDAAFTAVPSPRPRHGVATAVKSVSAREPSTSTNVIATSSPEASAPKARRLGPGVARSRVRGR